MFTLNKQKKRLLFVNGHLHIGGVERTLVDLVRHLDFSQYNVDVLVFEAGGEYIKELPGEANLIVFDTTSVWGPLGATLWNSLTAGRFRLTIWRIVMALSARFGARVFALLRNILPIKKRYDCAIAYRPGTCANFVAFAVNAPLKILWWHHGIYPTIPEQIATLTKTWNKFDKIISVSENLAKRLRSSFLSLAHRIYVIHNLIDPEDLLQKANDELTNDRENDCVELVSVGNLRPGKRFDNVILAAASLRQLLSCNFHWVIVGEGEMRPKLQHMIAEMHLENNVHLLGKKDNPYPFIRKADIFIHPSYTEALCTVILEAMALEIPCVVTKTDVPQDFTYDGVNCLETKQGADALAEGIRNMILLGQGRKELVINAKRMIDEEYRPEKILPKIYSLFDAAKE